MSYEQIIEFTLKYEGVLSDHPADRGGLTKYGISLKAAQEAQNFVLDVNDDGVIDSRDIRELDRETSIQFYKEEYWDKPFELDDFSSTPKKQFVIFDCNVNHGAGNTTRLIQSALKALGNDLVIDGRYGRITKGLLESADEDSFFDAMLDKRASFYNAIVRNRPNQKVFLRGWMNRINQMKQDVKLL